MSRGALRLAEQTGCLPTEANAALEASPDANVAKLTIESVMEYRRQRYGSVLSSVWVSFAGSEEADELDIDSVIAFVQALSLSLEEETVLAVAYELQAPKAGLFLKQPFIDGWARLEATDVASMQQAAVLLRRRMSSEPAYFREVYRFSFRFVLPEGSRMLPCETALDYWQLLLSPRFAPDLVKAWLEFAKKDGHSISSDTWNMTLQLFSYALADPQLRNYDETSAWPALIDDFVEIYKSSLACS